MPRVRDMTVLHRIHMLLYRNIKNINNNGYKPILKDYNW